MADVKKGTWDKIDQDFLEFETKYRTTVDKVYKFKDIIEMRPDVKDFLYVQGDDIYYTKKDDFLRHRLAAKGSKRAELTYKYTPKEAKNNIARTEVNLRVDANDESTVKKFTEVLKFKYNFRITKICHIYYAEDANLVFYSIKDHDDPKQKDMDHYIEIEVNEELCSKLTKEENMEVIRKWERILEPIGVKHQGRLPGSLFDMYRKF